MKLSNLLFCLVVFLYCKIAKSQSFNYVHYDVKEGLAGSTVYDLCQDQDGFLWMGTENGASRFDGAIFKNFSVNEGLPDNEVLKTFADSKGRVWFGTFTKEISYYYKGVVRNRKNTPLLNNPILKFQALFIEEDTDGNILFTDYKKAAIITPENVVIDFMALPEIKKRSLSSIAPNGCYFDKGFLIRFNDSIFQYKENKLIFYELDISKPGPNKLFPKYFRTRQDTSSERVELSIPSHIISTTTRGPTVIFQSTIDGAWSIDTTLKKLDQHFLPGLQIPRTTIDNEQNVWFATLTDGIYKLASAEMRTINFSTPLNRSNAEVYTIVPFEDVVLAGLGSSKVGLIKGNSLHKIFDYSDITRKSINPLSTNRLYCSYADMQGAVYLGFDAFLAKMESGKTSFADIIAIKAVEAEDNDHILVATSAAVLKLRRTDLKIVDTIWKGRCTEVFYYQDKYLVGSMNGLYEVNKQKATKYLGDIHPAFKRKISDIKSDKNSNLFIATTDMGVAIYRDGKVINWLTDENGLSSNICKAVYIDSGYAWVGTSAGINKIDLSNQRNIIRYGASDGLPSDNVNEILVVDSTVFVGTSAGLTFFKESRVKSQSQCRLVLDVQTQGKKAASGNYELSYRAPQIQFEFVGISYKSGGDIVYNYRLIGLDSAWTQTRQKLINFSALPAGDYTFQLFAVNKFGVKSEVRNIQFSISQPFWKSWWFYIGVLAITVFITAWIVNRKSARHKRRLMEEGRLQRQFVELEQQALQAQMNPGFIFNSLNSIQQYVQQNEKRKANQCLTGFAYLIRQTLDMSGRNKVALSEEIQYLKNFLDMENLKLEDRLRYSIEVAIGFRADIYEIPPLILQPYVDHVLQSALGNPKNDWPQIKVYFGLGNDEVVCSIKGNSEMRNAEAKTFNEDLEEYPAKAVLLAKKRIDLLNALGQVKIQVDVRNSTGDDGNAGSEVIIKIPTTIYAGTNPEYHH